MGWPAISLAQAHARMTAPGQAFETVQAVIDGRPQTVWKNAHPTLRELFLHARAQHGAKDFLVYDAPGAPACERASFEAYARATLCFAEALAAMGVGRGDRVAVVMRNLPEWPVAAVAPLLLGAIVSPVNAWGTPAELAYCLNDAGAKVAVVDAERWERLHGLLGELPQLQHLLVCRAEGQALDDARARHWSALLPATAGWADLPERPLPAVVIDPDDDATLLYTSGTTGAAKGALATHRCCTTTIMNGAFSVARSFVRRGEPVPDPAARLTQRAILLSVPLFHATGYQAILFGALQSGTKLVLMYRWEPERAMQLIQQEKVTQAGGVPTIAWQLIEHPDRERYDLSSLESVAYGGAPASAALVQRIVSTFRQAQPGMGWGMTETCATFTHHQGEDYAHRPDSAGPALPVGRMAIRDDDGRDLPAGQVGELWVYGPNVVKRYWNKPEQTAATFVDGWLRTGDLAYLDEEGFLFIVDRKKDMLIRGGENIYCAEVEAVLYRHPAVMDAAVVGQAHHTLGEEPVAVVQFKPGQQASEDELRAFARGEIAAFKVPVRIVASPGPLPRNPNGKLMKPQVKALFAELSGVAA